MWQLALVFAGCSWPAFWPRRSQHEAATQSAFVTTSGLMCHGCVFSEGYCGLFNKKIACLICLRHYSDFKNEDTLNSHLCCIASQMIMNKLDSPAVRGVEDETSLLKVQIPLQGCTELLE